MRRLLAALVLVATACSGAPEDPVATATPSSEPIPATLPVGGGISQTPRIGSIWSCQTTFGGGGAESTGDWISGETFDPSAKPTVDGATNWPSGFVAVVDGPDRRLSGDGLPDHPTGTFPVHPEDDAYAFDRNPNLISSYSLEVRLPAAPAAAESQSCLGLGPIGVMLTGAVFFNGLDAAGRDALAYEIQDDCAGHPQQDGVYHYHSLTPCVDDGTGGHSALVGYALDGFGLFGMRGEDGEPLAGADLDGCHGHAHTISWDEETTEMYHYHATPDYPYTLGCFRGTPVELTVAPTLEGGGSPPGGPPPGGRGAGPPPQ